MYGILSSNFRELVPRHFLTASFVRFSQYYPDFKEESSFETVIQTVRGMGNPILAIYAQMFLSRGFTSLDNISGVKTKYLFEEMLNVLNRLSKEKPQTYEKITFEDYLFIFKPAINWMILLLVKTNNDQVVINIIKNLETYVPEIHNLLLEVALDLMSNNLIVTNTKYLVDTCTEIQTPGIIASLGRALVRTSTQFPARDEIINTCWSLVTSLMNLDEFLLCAGVWIEFVAMQFSNKEVNKLMGLLIKKVQASKEQEYDTNTDLKDILLRIVRRRSLQLMRVLSLPNFLSVFSMITKEEVKAGLAKEILEELAKEDIAPSSDNIVHDLLTGVCDVLADSVTALTSLDERRQVSGLISNALARCTKLPDTQAQLSLLTEMR